MSHSHYYAATFKAQPVVLAFVVVLNERRADESHDPHLDTELRESSPLILLLHAWCGRVAVICDGHHGVLGGAGLNPLGRHFMSVTFSPKKALVSVIMAHA